jgi:hypothetical protein
MEKEQRERRKGKQKLVVPFQRIPSRIWFLAVAKAFALLRVAENGMLSHNNSQPHLCLIQSVIENCIFIQNNQPDGVHHHVHENSVQFMRDVIPCTTDFGIASFHDILFYHDWVPERMRLSKRERGSIEITGKPLT